MDLSKSLSSMNNKQKTTIEVADKAPIVREKPSLPSVSTNRQSLPVTLKDNPVANKPIVNAAPLVKDGPMAKPPKVPQISPVANKNPAPLKPPIEKPNEVGLNSENHDISHKQFSQLLERLQKLELTVENQKHAIEDLRNKLQIETDMRMMLQEKVLQKL